MDDFATVKMAIKYILSLLLLVFVALLLLLSLPLAEQLCCCSVVLNRYFMHYCHNNNLYVFNNIKGLHSEFSIGSPLAELNACYYIN